jgi:hypothetical protein
VKKGSLTRLKRGVYLRTEEMAHLSQVDLFRIANFLQVPSYISLMTALSYHGLTTQIQRGVIESISIKRTKTIEVGEFTFRYVKIRPGLYGGFEKVEGAFVAMPEKALLDSLYLASMGRYAMDVSSLDLEKFREDAVTLLSLLFPARVRNYMERHCEKAGSS